MPYGSGDEIRALRDDVATLAELVGIAFDEGWDRGFDAGIRTKELRETSTNCWAKSKTLLELRRMSGVSDVQG